MHHSAPVTEEAASETVRDWLADWLLYTPLLATTLCSKLAISSLSPAFSAAVPILIITPFIGLFTGRMRFHGERLGIFLVVVSLLWSMQLFNDRAFSLNSIMLMTTLFFTMVVYVPRPSHRVEDAIKFFIDFATFLAICGIAQFFLQFAVGPDLAFPIEHFLPSKLLIQQFNYLNHLSYGSKTLKSNGVFLLEPSQFSQLLAIATIAELMLFNRLRRLIPFGLGLVVAYSGTGLMILALCLPIVIFRQRRWDLLASLLVALVFLAAFSEKLNLDIFTKRAGEFGATGSSAFARFVGGFYAFDDWLWPYPMRALFGYGAGAYADMQKGFTMNASEMPLNKVMIEFGLVGSVALFGFLILCMIKGSGPGVLRLAVGFSFFLNALYVPTAQGIALSVIIWNCTVERGAGLAKVGTAAAKPSPG